MGTLGIEEVGLASMEHLAQRGPRLVVGGLVAGSSGLVSLFAHETEHRMNLIQICASQNDLFALDADGTVYHYNFNTHSWMRLGRGRHEREAASLTGEEGRERPGRLRTPLDADHRPTRSDDRS